MKLMIDNNTTPQDYTRNGQNVPPKPKPGEPIICQYCSEIIYPSQFSEDSFQRKFEFKWHLHPWCKEAMISQADRGTPGLIEERKRAARQLEENNENLINKSTSNETGITPKKAIQAKKTI